MKIVFASQYTGTFNSYICGPVVNNYISAPIDSR